MATQNPVRLVGDNASPCTLKMLALLRYRRLPCAVTWGQPDQVCDAFTDADRARVDALLQGPGVETMFTLN